MSHKENGARGCMDWPMPKTLLRCANEMWRRMSRTNLPFSRRHQNLGIMLPVVEFSEISLFSGIQTYLRPSLEREGMSACAWYGSSIIHTLKSDKWTVNSCALNIEKIRWKLKRYDEWSVHMFEVEWSFGNAQVNPYSERYSCASQRVATAQNRKGLLIVREHIFTTDTFLVSRNLEKFRCNFTNHCWISAVNL